MRHGGNRVLAWTMYSLVALLGIAVIVVGFLESGLHLMFGGTVMLLMGVISFAWDHAMRPGEDGVGPSGAERAAWWQMSMRLSVCLGLAGWALASRSPDLASYLMFCFFALITLLHPLFRRRFMQENLRRNEVAEDERDRALQVGGERFSRRLLELTLVTMAVSLAFFPGAVHALANPLQAGSLILLSILLASAAGDGVVVHRYWRERQ